MLKKIISIALSTIIMCSVVSCSKTGVNGKTDKNGIADNGKLTISIALMMGPKIDNTWMQKQLEERLDVNIKFVMLPGWDDAATKIQLLMADDQTRPDVIWWWGGTQKVYNEWIDNGVLVDLAPILESGVAPNLLKFVTSAQLPATFTSDDKGNHIWGLPSDVEELSSTTGLIRQDWLDNLGLEMPTTLEQYTNVLDAFTNNDPNKSGKKDTYGFNANYEEHNFRFWTNLFAPFNSIPTEFIKKEDGTSVYGGTQPETKEALEYIADIYKKGYINPNSLVKTDWATKMAQGLDGSYYMWVTYLNKLNPEVLGLTAANPEANLVSFEIPKKDGSLPNLDDGTDGTPWSYIGITKSCKDPAATLAALDKLATGDEYIFRTWGEKGTHWDYDEKGEFKTLVTPSESDKLGLNVLQVFNFKDENNIINAKETIEMFEKRKETSQTYRDMVGYVVDDTPVKNEKMQDLYDLQDQYFVKIITGEYSIDKFDEFVTEFYNNGGKEVEEENTMLTKKRDETVQKVNEYWKSIGGTGIDN